MQYSDYLKYIFCKADNLCAKYGIKYRAIESIYIAMLCEYEAEYETNDPPIMYGNSIEYEREKAEYIIQQCHFDINSRFMSILLKRRKECIASFDITLDVLSDAEEIAKMKKQSIVSADIMLIAILSRLSLPFSRFLQQPLKDVLLKAFNTASENASSFMEDKIAKRLARIEKEERKAKELEAYINRKPVEKVGQEEEVRNKIIDSILVKKSDNNIVLTLPYYYVDSNEPLALILTQKDGKVYASDAGRSYRELRKRLHSRRLATKMAQYFSRVDFELKLNYKNEVVTPIRDISAFFDYIQVLSRIANADLYPDINKGYYLNYKKYARTYKFPKRGEVPTEFIELLLNKIKVSYDMDRGITVHSPFYFNDEPCPMQICFKVTEDNKVSTTDFGDYDGGRLDQRMHWLNEDIHIYDEKIAEICSRFNCLFQNEKTVHIFDNNSEEAIPKAFFTFMQAASILGEIGHFVVLK